MARILLTLLGVGLLGLGIWLMLTWWSVVWPFLLAIAALAITLIGLVLFIFGISEIVGALSHKAPQESPPPESN